MNYAINKITDILEVAIQASRYAQYKCPVCKKGVSLRRGNIKAPYFAHLPGNGTLECENFVPNHSSLSARVNLNILVKRRMELRLLISTERKNQQWLLELALPTCNFCQAKMTLDVGGRSQTIDMSSMVKRRQIGAELSVQPYRIISFFGDPDPEFIAEVEMECQGLPSIGAAVFTASGSGESRGFSLAHELRCDDTYAFLWQQPVQPHFPDELVVEKLVGKQGWNLVLVTIPESLSSDCAAWLQLFTNLPIFPARPSITTILPFLTKNISINQIECLHSNVVLLSANNFSLSTQSVGPTLHAQGSSSILSATAVDKSSAFFSLNPSHSELVGISDSSNQDTKIFLSFSSDAKFLNKYPSVDLVFTKNAGGKEIVSLHERRCAAVITEARLLGHGLEYISMPNGVEGSLKVEGPAESSNIKLFSNDSVAPHDENMLLLQHDTFCKLAMYLKDPTYYLEIEFCGLGRLSLPALLIPEEKVGTTKNLSPTLRLRLLSFIFQMRLITPDFIIKNDDLSLVDVLGTLNPETHLLPHYRALVKDVITSGFEFNRLR
ncbi:competence protein CoiA family protein [Pectobacterium aroidearum]|uniref:competence protein CoiA family protein n=1 Tax=Pectobacterium aroidearum TaxID=1201031 RepID=UPI002A80C488|nr:hypothetical protein [Pectobacterium aroidearum]MDY4388716.1 hypothetical protein [Pectobacterium aroidearum]